MMQLDMFQLRDDGMQRAADAQHAKSPDWADAAYLALLKLAAKRPTVHVDDLLSEFTRQPEHPNAWGAVWMRAIRAGIIEHSGTVRPCKVHRHKHAHQYPVYRSLVFASSVLDASAVGAHAPSVVTL